MDFLNKAFAQLSDLFQSMSPGARITAGLLLVVVVVSLGYLFTFQVSGPDTDLMNGEPVPASYLPKMEAAFAEQGLKQYEVRGTQIRVPRAQKSAYMAALADGNALPPNFGKALREAVNAGNTFESSKGREQRFKVAIQDELALIISRMTRGSASVLYQTQKKGGLHRETVTTATVAVKPLGSEDLDDSRLASIRHLVAGAIGGQAENVNVTDLNSGRTYHGDPKNGGSLLDDPYGSRKRMYEQEWNGKILDQLAYVPGVLVTANVELDPESINRVRNIKHDPKGFTVREYSEESSRTREDSVPAGRPGFPAQQPNTATALSASRSRGSQETEDDSKREAITVTNTEQTESEKVGLTPTRVSVAIGIPSSYFEKVWKERNLPEDGQEPQTPDPAALKTIEDEEKVKIQSHVAALLPEVAGVDDPTQLVNVTTFQDIPAEEMPAPGLGKNALVWFGRHWSTLGMVGLALFSLVMLRSMIRVVPADRQAESRPRHSAGHTEEAEEESPESAAARRLRRFTGSGRSLRDELSELVQEDSDAAANILRTWISSSS